VQFLKPVRTGVPLRVTAEVLEQRKRIVIARPSWSRRGVRARASGKFVVVPKPAGSVRP